MKELVPIYPEANKAVARSLAIWIIENRCAGATPQRACLDSGLSEVVGMCVCIDRINVIITKSYMWIETPQIGANPMIHFSQPLEVDFNHLLSV